MALDPRLSLAFQPMPIQTPDLLRTLLGAENIKASMQQQQVRSLQLAELVKSQEQERQMMEYLRMRYAAQQPPGSNLASLVGQSPLAAPSDAGPIAQSAFGASGAGQDERWPAVVPSRDPSQPATLDYGSAAPSGQGMPSDSIEQRIAGARAQGAMPPQDMPQVAGASPLPQEVPQVAGAAPAQRDIPQVAGPPLPGMAAPAAAQAVPTWQEFAQFGKPGRDMHDWVQQGQVREAQMRVHELDRQMKGIDAFERGMDLVSDQRSLDNFKTQLRQVSPALADMLPDTYDADDMKRRREQLIPLKTRLEQQRMGLNPIYGTDASGKTVVMFPTQGGELRQPTMPPGVEIASGVEKIDAGTHWVLRDKRTNQPLGTVPKNIPEAEAQKVEGKYEGERGALARQATSALSTLDQKHRLVEQNIDAILETLKSENVPSTGTIGWMTSGIRGSNAYNTAAKLQQVKSNLGLDELMTLKASGGTLGQVTEAEHRLLQTTLANLDQFTDKQQLVDELTRLKATLAENRQRRKAEYDRNYGDLDVSGPTTRRRTSDSGGQVTGKVITRAQIQELAQKRGVSEADVEQRAKASGYRIQD